MRIFVYSSILDFLNEQITLILINLINWVTIFIFYLCPMTIPEYTEHQAVTKVAKKDISFAAKKTPEASPLLQVQLSLGWISDFAKVVCEK